MTTQANRRIRPKSWVWGVGLSVLFFAVSASPALAQNRGGNERSRDSRSYNRPTPAAVNRASARNDNRGRDDYGHDNRRYDNRSHRRPSQVSIVNNYNSRHGYRNDDYCGRGSKNKIGVSVNFGQPAYSTTVVRRVWIAERYEDRVEQVCVEPECYETRYIPEVVETRYDACGRPYTVVICPARYERVLIPARYESHVTRVCIPGYWDEVVEHCPVPTTSIIIGGVFRF